MIVEKQGKLVLEPAGRLDVQVDSTVPTPGAELVLERLGTMVGPQLIQGALANQQGVALPAVKGVTLTGLKVGSIDGNLVLLGTAQ
jgi:hypothetical protein